MNNEIWVNIPGHEEYEVSSMGRVMSVERIIPVRRGLKGVYAKTVRERILNPICDWSGHFYVNIKKRHFKIHALVMLAFVGARPSTAIIRHLDGNPKNNNLDNLIYSSQSQNRLDASRHDRHKYSRDLVAKIKAAIGSSRKLAKEFGVSRTYVRLLKAGKARTCG